MNKETWNSSLFENVDSIYFIIFIVCLLIIFYYGWYRCKYIKNQVDILEFKLFKNVKNLDGWTLDHLIFYTVIGYMYPYSIRLTFLFGCIWELFEFWVGIYKPSILSEFGFCNSLNSDQQDKVWWYGKWEDIITNLIGLIIGRTIRLCI